MEYIVFGNPESLFVLVFFSLSDFDRCYLKQFKFQTHNANVTEFFSHIFDRREEKGTTETNTLSEILGVSDRISDQHMLLVCNVSNASGQIEKRQRPIVNAKQITVSTLLRM